MYSVIAFDFDLDLFVGSRRFDSLDEAREFLAYCSASEPDSVTVWIQDSDGNQL